MILLGKTHFVYKKEWEGAVQFVFFILIPWPFKTLVWCGGLLLRVWRGILVYFHFLTIIVIINHISHYSAHTHTEKYFYTEEEKMTNCLIISAG